MGAWPAPACTMGKPIARLTFTASANIASEAGSPRHGKK